MKTVVENWAITVSVVVTVAVAALAIYQFFLLPTDKQKEKVKEWLVWACIEAEKALQSGTGQAKLRRVYNAFIAVRAFSWLAKIISFDTFSAYVSEALAEAKKMIINSESLAVYVYGDHAETEVEKLREQVGDAVK